MAFSDLALQQMTSNPTMSSTSALTTKKKMQDFPCTTCITPHYVEGIKGKNLHEHTCQASIMSSLP